MWWLTGYLAKKSRNAQLRKQSMGIYDHLAERTLQLTAEARLGMADEFPLRFDVMVLLVAGVLHRLRQQSGLEELAQILWEMTFEGFEESLRNRGVTDIRMAARMRKLLMEATGRRNVYLAAWDGQDQTALQSAIARNILNSKEWQDPRVGVLLEAVQEVKRIVGSINLDASE